jgi:hypothetical protein
LFGVEGLQSANRFGGVGLIVVMGQAQWNFDAILFNVYASICVDIRYSKFITG